MKPQDQELAKIAEAVKRVMNKETEVQPADKDFVDLHSIDKEKRRGSTPLTEKDIEEANEFTKAAAKAAVAGDDEFEFDGKKYPTEMDIDVAKKILGESTELDEASIEVDFMYPKAAWFQKLLKKYRLKMKIINPGGGDGGTDVIKLDGKKKDIKGILKDPKGFDDDGFMAQNIEEGKFDKLKKKLKSINPETLGDVLNGKIELDPAERKEFDRFMADAQKMFGKEFVKSFEAFDIEEEKFGKLKKKLKGLNPEKLTAVLKGKIKLDPDEKKEFDSYMADAKKMFAKLPKSSPIKTMFGKELVKALESVDSELDESTAEYAKSLEKIANDRKMKNLSKQDKATLMKIAAMMAKEGIEEMNEAPGKYAKKGDKDKYQWGDINKAMMDAGMNPPSILKVLSKLRGKELQEDAERMPYDKVIKKLRDGEWDTSMDVKKRMHLTYTDNTERRKHLRGIQKVVFVEDVDIEEKPTSESNK